MGILVKMVKYALRLARLSESDSMLQASFAKLMYTRDTVSGPSAR